MHPQVGKLEEETNLQDLDQLERDLENSAVDDLNVAQAAPAPAATTATPSASATFTQATRGRASRFMASVIRSTFFPGQTSQTAQPGKAPGMSHNIVPPGYFDKRRAFKAANVNDPQAQPVTPGSKFMKAPQRSLGRQTLDALLSLGTLPAQLVKELGLLRYAKERQFNSLLRLERALGQGNEDAEQFLRANPKALKKDAPKKDGPSLG